MNRRIPNGMYGGVRGRGLAAPSYSISAKIDHNTYARAGMLLIADLASGC